MNPQELTLLISAVANALYENVPADELAVLAAIFNQLGDTLETLAAQAALLQSGKAGTD